LFIEFIGITEAVRILSNNLKGSKQRLRQPLILGGVLSRYREGLKDVKP